MECVAAAYGPHLATILLQIKNALGVAEGFWKLIQQFQDIFAIVRVVARWMCASPNVLRHGSWSIFGGGACRKPVVLQQN
jgi:hypothetical protein